MDLKRNFALQLFLRTFRTLTTHSLPLALFVTALSAAPLCLRADAQALTTSGRVGDLQVGGGFSVAESDYETFRLKGAAFYSSFDFKPHFGIEVDFHQLDHSSNQLYERSYEAGGRYVLHHGALAPYAKALYGRGVLNYPNNYANLGYNMIVGGGGVDIGVRPWLNVRADFEYQQWFSGPGIPHGITPKVATLGAAYRFGSGKPRGRQWFMPKESPVKSEKAKPAAASAP